MKETNAVSERKPRASGGSLNQIPFKKPFLLSLNDLCNRNKIEMWANEKRWKKCALHVLTNTNQEKQKQQKLGEVHTKYIISNYGCLPSEKNVQFINKQIALFFFAQSLVCAVYAFHLLNSLIKHVITAWPKFLMFSSVANFRTSKCQIYWPLARIRNTIMRYTTSELSPSFWCA